MAEKKNPGILNPEEIECRVGAIMEQGITLLLYKKCKGRPDHTGRSVWNLRMAETA